MEIAKIKDSIHDELTLKTNLVNLFGSNSYRPLLDQNLIREQVTMIKSNACNGRS